MLIKSYISLLEDKKSNVIFGQYLEFFTTVVGIHTAVVVQQKPSFTRDYYILQKRPCVFSYFEGHYHTTQRFQIVKTRQKLICDFTSFSKQVTVYSHDFRFRSLHVHYIQNLGLFFSVEIMVFDFLHFVFFQVQYIHYC